MKIIGHRGAAGLAPENTLLAIKTAVKSKVDAIEFDIRRTKDARLVLCHDKDIKRMYGSAGIVEDMTLEELRAFKLPGGGKFIEITEALDACKQTPVIIEIKVDNVHQILLPILEERREQNISVASFRHGELRAIRHARPDIDVYVLEHLSPFEIINSARNMHATGIGLNAWLLNPLTYWLTKYHGLQLFVYTVNNTLIARLIRKLYPRAMVCTDYPNKLQRLKNESNISPRRS